MLKITQLSKQDVKRGVPGGAELFVKKVVPEVAMGDVKTPAKEGVTKHVRVLLQITGNSDKNN